MANRKDGRPIHEHCVFCGRSQDQVDLLISAENASICSDCALTAYEYAKEVLNPRPLPIKTNGKIVGDPVLLKPKEITDFLSQYVIGQDEARKRLQWLYIIITRGLITRSMTQLKNQTSSSWALPVRVKLSWHAPLRRCSMFHSP